MRFFRFIWRADAILIFVAAIIVIGAIGWFLIDEFLRNMHHSPPQGEPVISNPSAPSRPYRLRGFEIIQGAGAARADLVTEKVSPSGFSSSGGSYDETHNVLWVTLADGKTRWLIPDHKMIVTFSEDITRSGKEIAATPSNPLATLFLIKTDVPEIESAGGSIILASPNGEKQEPIASDVTSVEGWDLTAGAELVIACTSPTGYRLITVDLSTLKKISEIPVEIPK